MGVGGFCANTAPDVQIVALNPVRRTVYGLRNLDEGSCRNCMTRGADLALFGRAARRIDAHPATAAREGSSRAFLTGAILHAALGPADRAVGSGESGRISASSCATGLEVPVDRRVRRHDRGRRAGHLRQLWA